MAHIPIVAEDYIILHVWGVSRCFNTGADKLIEEISKWIRDNYDFYNDEHICWKPEYFSRLKDLLGNAMIIQMDLSNDEKGRHLGAYLRENKFDVIGMYLSNIPYFLMTPPNNFCGIPQAGRQLKLSNCVSHICGSTTRR